MSTRGYWGLGPGLSCLAVLGLACVDGQPAATGERAQLQVEGATYWAEPLPLDGGGPEVRATYLAKREFPERTQLQAFSGALSQQATAVAIGLATDPAAERAQGYWVVPAGPPAAATPTLPSFDAALSFAEDLLPGLYRLQVVALDGSAVAGPVTEVQFSLSERSVPTGELVFALAWDRDADLDLRVITPEGEEIYDANASAGEDALRGYLEVDSNSQCRIDGRRQEHILWPETAPAGRYVVRVDTFSMCGERAARWRVTASYRGALVAAVAGTTGPSATRFDHGRGAGLTVLEFTVE